MTRSREKGNDEIEAEKEEAETDNHHVEEGEKEI